MRIAESASVRALFAALIGLNAAIACSGEESPASVGKKRDAGRGGTSGSSGGAPVADAATDGASDADAQTERGTDGSERTVRGVVVSFYSEPLSNITIVINGTSAVTDTTGRFEIRDVPDAYDLIAADENGAEVTMYRGLTRRDPVIERQSSENKQAYIVGVLSGGAWPNGPTNLAAVAFGFPGSIRDSGTSRVMGDREGPAYSLTASWGGTASKQGFVCALRWSRGPPLYLPTDYLGWGCSDVTVSSGAALDADIVMNTTLQMSSLSGTFQLPSGYTVSSFGVGIYRDDVPLNISLFSGGPGDLTFSVPVPTGPADLKFSVGVNAESAGASSFTQIVGPAATALTVPIDEAPRVASPLIDATGVGLSTNFAWNAAGVGAYLVRLQALAPSNRRIAIYTNETRITLPDLTSLGLSLPSNQPFVWSVTGGPAATVDEAASVLRRASALQLRRGTSAERRFTTAP